jgi:hypothetical protein
MKNSEPPGWGKDSLSNFIDTAWHNTFATFHSLQPQYTFLKDLDQLFRFTIDNLINSPDWFPAFFVLRSHSAYLGAVRMGISGQLPESYMILRGSLESALYGLYIAKNPNSSETWLKRHDDGSSLQRAKNEFTAQRVLKCLKLVDRETHLIAKILYDRTIDHGAHPNVSSILPLLNQKKENGYIQFSLLYLTGQNLPFDLCLKTNAEVGICTLDIFRNIFQHRFEIVGIEAKLIELKKRINLIWPSPSKTEKPG